MIEKFKIGDSVIILRTEVFAEIVKITEKGYILEDVYGKVLKGIFQDNELDIDN